MKATDHVSYKIVLIDEVSRKILCVPSSIGVTIPTETIPASERPAMSLIKTIRDRYGITTIQLAILPGDDGKAPCAVHQLLCDRRHVDHSRSFYPLVALKEEELSAFQRETVASILCDAVTGLGRFSRIGWTEELCHRLGSVAITEIAQVNSGIDFCLLSMKCNGRKLWFKAVGKPNIREYPLTMILAGNFPHFLPPLYLAIPEWNAWVSEDVPGVPLGDSQDPALREDAISALAMMQRACVEHTDVLFSAGAVDWSSSRLLNLVDPFFVDAALAMEAQTSVRAPALTRNELGLLKSSIAWILTETVASGIPETLMHGDIGHGNLIASPAGPIFLDWAETYIGPPFISAEHLLADVEQTCGLPEQEKKELRRLYASHWKGEVSLQCLNWLSATAPALAAFAYGVIAWEINQQRRFPEKVWPLIRSMLRRTKRELEYAREVVA